MIRGEINELQVFKKNRKKKKNNETKSSFKKIK